MLGIGEQKDEVAALLRDIAAAQVDILTIGQYLSPSKEHAPIDRWVHPDEFAEWKAFALAAGVKHVESGPLVRSSYHADEQAVKFGLMERRRLPAR
jgi:lipoic acid synthetase